MTKYIITLKSFLKVHLEVILLSIMTFLAPIKGLVLIAGFLVIIDTIFGIYNNCFIKKQPFTSRRFSTFITKTLIYQGAIILSFMIDFYLLNELTKLFISVDFISTKLIALSVFFTEIKSIEETFKSITGIDLWKNLKQILYRTKELKDDIENLNQ